DKVGLLIFTDRIELLIPPRKGRSHVLRLVREMLVFEPQGRGTDVKLALDTINLVLKRRSVLFLISDFLTDPEVYRKPLASTNRRHDVVVVDLYDPLEEEIARVGLLALEDAETGELKWVDTNSRKWRESFQRRVQRLEYAKNQMFTSLNVDRVKITTAEDYVAGLTAFFKERSRRAPR
ncbi:MAG: VWA domain-containing protein, partial [Chloroflexi bacterium]|nr:VWA domain-containing protein [Chloroflexota bacterium]